MKITNRLGLPETFRRYAERNPYQMGKADYSTTTLIDSPRQSRLKNTHRESIEEDVSDMIMSLLGTAVHSVLEGGASDDDIVEKRLFADFWGTVITGQIDLMMRNPDTEGYILCDYKTTSAYAIMRDPEGKDSWHHQLNVYAAIARANGFKVAGLEVVAGIRDWSARAMERSPSYPKSAVVRIPIDLWHEDEANGFIESRIVAHEESKNILPECSAEERWLTPTVWAVYKKVGTKTNKRASKLFQGEEEAVEFARGSTEDARRKGGKELPEYVVIKRVGESIRCKSYCSVSQCCEQWKAIKENEND